MNADTASLGSLPNTRPIQIRKNPFRLSRNKLLKQCQNICLVHFCVIFVKALQLKNLVSGVAKRSLRDSGWLNTSCCCWVQIARLVSLLTTDILVNSNQALLFPWSFNLMISKTKQTIKANETLLVQKRVFN